MPVRGQIFFFVVTNDGWYLDEAGAYQHAAHSVLRAVETRRPVIRSGNNGWSGWIDPLGRIRHVVADDTGNIYVQKVDAFDVFYTPHWQYKLSFYVRYGNSFIGFCLGVFLITWIYCCTISMRRKHVSYE